MIAKKRRERDRVPRKGLKISLPKVPDATHERPDGPACPVNFRLGNQGEFVIYVLTLRYTWALKFAASGV